jgi:hypothetical protein
MISMAITIKSEVASTYLVDHAWPAQVVHDTRLLSQQPFFSDEGRITFFFIHIVVTSPVSRLRWHRRRITQVSRRAWCKRQSLLALCNLALVVRIRLLNYPIIWAV